VTAVKATKRKKLVLASLWTEMCLACRRSRLKERDLKSTL